MPTFHQIWQGDSAEQVLKIHDKTIDCIITDPPFGVDNQSNMAQTAEGKKYARKIANDESPEVAIQTFKKVITAAAPKTRDHCDLYIFTSYQVLSDWMVMTDEFLPQFGWNRKAVIVWEKDGPGMGDLNCPWGMGMEFILFFQKPGRREKIGTRRNSVLHIPQVRPGELVHPHEKPLPLLEHLIKASTLEGDFVFDPFGGSGSLVRAARRVRRNAVAIEYDEHNAQLANRKLNEGEGAGMF